MKIFYVDVGGISGLTCPLAGAASVDRTPHERRSNRFFSHFNIYLKKFNICQILVIISQKHKYAKSLQKWLHDWLAICY